MSDLTTASGQRKARRWIVGRADLHRIDEATLRQEVEVPGFRFVSSSDALRNPPDTRDWNDSPREAGPKRGTSDRFVLKFVKP